MNCQPCIADEWVSNARRENALADKLDIRAMLEGSLAPVRWWQAGYYRCLNGHVTREDGKATRWGRSCPKCGAYSLMTFPEDKDGEL